MQAQLSRRERERAARREAMLEAARAVFAEKGFRTATLDEIAQRAEFGKGTLYNYFEGGKEDLLFTILDDVHSDLQALIERAFGSGPVGRTFRDCMHAYTIGVFDYFFANQDLFVILMKEANRLCFGDEPEKAVYFKNHYDRMLSIVKPALKAAMEAGEIKHLPLDPVAHMLLGNIDGFVRFSFFDLMTASEGTRPAPSFESGAAADFLTEVLFDGLRIHSAPSSNPPATRGDGSSDVNDLHSDFNS